MKIFDSPSIQHVISLLSNAGLPTQDLGAEGTMKFFGCGDEEDPAGVIGLEIHGSYGLLRSLVVSAGAQNQGCGKALVQRVELQAKASRLDDIYLLTETAEDFFNKLGYRVCNRKDVAMPIQHTAEFSGLCPDTAIVMKKHMSTS